MMRKPANSLKKRLMWPMGLAGLGLFVAGSALWAQVPETQSGGQSGAPMVTLPGQDIAPPPPGATDTPHNAYLTYGESPYGDTGVIEEPSAGSYPDDGPVELPTNQPNWQAPTPTPSAQLPENASREYSNAQAVSPQASAGADLADFGRQNPGGEIAGDRVSQADRLERPLPPAKLQPLLALANTLGALHAVRIRCGSHDDQTYRTRMAAILAIEAPVGTQRRRTLVERFNNGFATHGQGQGPCDPATNRMEETLARSGEILARQLAAAYRPAPPPTPPAAPASAPAGPPRATGPHIVARPTPSVPQTNGQRAATRQH